MPASTATLAARRAARARSGPSPLPLLPRVLLGLLLAALLGPLAAPAGAVPPVPPPPQLHAKAWILMDFHSGKVLAEHAADQRVEPASLTKLMTAYVVQNEIRAGRLKLEDQVRISEKAWRTPGSRTFVEPGTKVSVEDLILGMVVQSGNDATVALAEHVAGSEELFVALMNQQAKALGLEHTHFANSTGLPDPQHYTTARDLARLTRALIRDFPEHYAWYKRRSFTFNGIKQYNRNRLLWQDPRVDGVKTGHTDSAGYCLVASGVQDGMRLISVVLGTASDKARARESEKLLAYGFRFYETHRLYRAGQPVVRERVWKGEVEELPLGLRQDLYVTIPRGAYGELQASREVRQPILAPVAKGAALGRVTVRLGQEVVARRPLVALRAVPEGNLLRQLTDEVLLWLE